MLIVDAHMHPLLPPEKLLEEMGQANITKAFLIGLDLLPAIIEKPNFKRKFLVSLTQRGFWNINYITEIRRLLTSANISNEKVKEYIAFAPERFIGIGSVNPNRSLSHIRKKLEEICNFGFLGVKLIPTLQFFHPLKKKKELKMIFNFCRKEKLLVIIHTGCDPLIWEDPFFSQGANPENFQFLVRKFRDVPVILAHMGSYSAREPGIWLNEAVALGAKYDNVLFDLAAVTYLVTQERHVKIIRELVGFERVLFGSDFPVVKGETLKTAVEKVLNSPFLTNSEKEKVLGLNALKLYTKK